MAGKKYGTILLSNVEGELQKQGCSREELDTLTFQDVIYVYYNKKAFYVGQTHEFLKRHGEHLRETGTDYREFTHVIVLFGQFVDRNSSNDLEKQLITYLTADHGSLPANQRRECRNGTGGNKSTDYSYRAEVYSQVLVPFWEQELRQAGLVHNISLEELRQSILFKYSPFTELSAGQDNILREILDSGENFLVEGLAGTGKTVMLTNLAVRLAESGLKTGVSVKSNWSKLAQSIFDAYGVRNITTGTPYQLIKSENRFDVLLVDEAHRLRWNYPKQSHFQTDIFDQTDPQKNELFLLGQRCRRMVLLYDPLQRIRPSDIPRGDFVQYIEAHAFQERELDVQFRIQVNDTGEDYTATDYIHGICSFLGVKKNVEFNAKVFQNPSQDAYFGIVDSIHELFEYTNRKRQHHPNAQCKVLAGYARPWYSHRNPESKRYREFDWIEDEENRWKWNSSNKNWIALPTSDDEIGSIHAVQGMDLDYVGVVIAKDLAFRDGAVTAVRENYYDTYGTPPKSAFNSSEDLSEYIQQIYYVLLTRGIRGIRVYFEDPALKRHFMEEVGLA